MSPRADPKPPKRTALKPRAARAHRRAGALVRQAAAEAAMARRSERDRTTIE